MTVAEKKIVHHRLNALELAKALGNVSEACRRRGICRCPSTEPFNYRMRPVNTGGTASVPPVGMMRHNSG